MCYETGYEGRDHTVKTKMGASKDNLPSGAKVQINWSTYSCNTTAWIQQIFQSSLKDFLSSAQH